MNSAGKHGATKPDICEYRQAGEGLPRIRLEPLLLLADLIEMRLGRHVLPTEEPGWGGRAEQRVQNSRLNTRLSKHHSALGLGRVCVWGVGWGEDGVC